MTESLSQQSASDALVEAVQEHLHAIWPMEMSRETGSGLQWGQLVAHAAVAAVRQFDVDASGRKEQP